jgi:hypothetical protein
LEAVLDVLVNVAELAIFGSENGVKMASSKNVRKLREMIRAVRKQLDDLSLKLWYPLPHLVPQN